MLKKPWKMLNKNEFLRSSAIVFISNLGVGISNYLLVIFASRALEQEYSMWTALSGLVAILGTFNTGLFTEINKTFANFARQSPDKALFFYDFVMHKTKILLVSGILLSPILGWILTVVTQTGNMPILATLVIGIFLGIYTGINRFLLLGMLHNLKFGIVNLITGAARFIPTLLLFELGIKIWALPLGLLCSHILSYLVANYFIRQVRKTNKTQETKSYKFSLKKYINTSIKSTIILFTLAVILNVSPIIYESTQSEETRDLFAVIFNFGQMIHFGSVAFTQAIIVHAVRSKTHRIYYFSMGLMTTLTGIIAGIFYFFGEYMLELFGRSIYADQIKLILFYSIFILLYNAVFISVQYLLSRNYYTFLIKSLVAICIILILNIYTISTISDSLYYNILSQIITLLIATVFYFIYIHSLSLKKEKILQNN